VLPTGNRDPFHVFELIELDIVVIFQVTASAYLMKVIKSVFESTVVVMKKMYSRVSCLKRRQGGIQT